MSTLRAALRYAAHDGWFIVPVAEKRPLTDHAVLDATTDLDVIRAWFDRWPLANIGCALGPSGLVVLDEDGPEARPARLALGLPPTLVSTTGRGCHVWYRLPQGAHVATTVLAPKLDLRAAGTQCVLPPSIHRNGREYRWANNLEIATLTMAEIGRLRPPGATRSVRLPKPRRDRSGDPLHAIAPADYVFLLTGLRPNRAGYVPCPFHDDKTPSLRVYATAELGWHDYGACNRGGDIYSFAQALWPELGFPQVRERLVELVTTGAGAEAAA